MASEDLVLDVEVCRTGFLDDNCALYGDDTMEVYKPTGILHDYGENNSMYFSLITGSYDNNLRGGVLRQTMSSFGEEDLNGDRLFTPEEQLTGIKNLDNPLSSPTIVATYTDDIILSNSEDGSGATGSILDATTMTGRTSWRELEP